jgi:phosphopantetheinyl transferase (holo-ACP synthase)
MGVDMTKDCQKLAVKAVSFPHQRRTVLYTCSPSDIEPISSHRGSRTADKIHLVAILLEHLVGLGRSPWTDCRFLNRNAFPIQVVHDQLGKPHLLLGGHRGPAISFSEGGERVWAALCADKSEIGMDVAGTYDFQGEYPFQRVFHAEELHHALRLEGADVAKASALLWSIKEAAVKALGCGFHLVDPREIYVHPSAEGDGGHTFSVCLSGKALARFPESARGSLSVRSFPQGEIRLSIALLNQQP